MAQGQGKVLLVDTLDVTTSKPGQPMTYKTFTKGQTVEGLSDGRVKELNDQSILGTKSDLDPDAARSKPGPSRAPKDPTGAGDQPQGSGAGVAPLSAEDAGKLKGAELDAALTARSLSTDGDDKAKQARLVESVSA